MAMLAGMARGTADWQMELMKDQMDTEAWNEAEAARICEEQNRRSQSSMRRKYGITGDLVQARDLIQKAAQLIEDSAYGTVWEADLLKVADQVLNVSSIVDDVKEIIKGW